VKSTIIHCLIVFFLVAFAEVVGAQDVQVPIDDEGKLQYIDWRLEQRLGLFPEYTNFQEARLFQTSDEAFILEIYYQPRDRLLRIRRPLSAEQTEEFRHKVTERIRQQAPQVVLDQTGRARLLTGTMALSLGYYGWAVPVALNLDSPKLGVALYMLSSGAGFFIPFSATAGFPVTDGAAALSTYLATRGIAHGILSYHLVLGEETTARGAIAFGMVGSIVEGVLGFRAATRTNMSAGTAEVIGVGGDFGIGWGLGTAHLAGFFQEDSRRPAMGSILAGSGVGLLAGRILASREHYTRGDADVLRAAGILGAYAPLAIIDIIGTENEKSYTTASMIGSVLGLAMGHDLVGGKDFSDGDGILITLSEVAGGLAGLGFAYLFSSDGDNSELFLTLSSLGAGGGFWLSYRSLAQGARTLERGSSWNINVAPEGLVALATGKRARPGLETSGPLISIDFRF